MKRCSKCGVEKPCSEFTTNKKAKSGLTSQCLKCINEHKARWRARNPGGHRSHHLRSKYGLTLDDFARMLEDQNYTCLLCDHKHVENDQRLALRVDHNHISGEVRGLLCNNCNSAIGLLGDSPERLRSAARYLERKGHYGPT